MRTATRLIALSLTLGMPLVGLTACSSTPTTRDAADEKISQANATIETMAKKDPSIRPALADAYGYVVFSTVGSGALIVGGEGGGGIVFEGGNPWGTATLAKGSIGLQVGGESYSELIIFLTKEAFDRFTTGEFTFTAEASATAVTANAAAEAPVIGGAKVLTMAKGGLIASAAVGGQNFSCTPFAE